MSNYNLYTCSPTLQQPSAALQGIQTYYKLSQSSLKLPGLLARTPNQESPLIKPLLFSSDPTFLKTSLCARQPNSGHQSEFLNSSHWPHLQVLYFQSLLQNSSPFLMKSLDFCEFHPYLKSFSDLFVEVFCYVVPL